MVIAPLAAVLFSLQQGHRYQATAEVWLSNKDYSVLLTGFGGGYVPPDRILETAADLARVPTVAARAITLARVPTRTPADLLANSSVSPKTNADLLDFRVTDEIPAIAARLATAYARAYITYRHELDTSSLRRAANQVRTQIEQLESIGNTKSSLYLTLVQKEQQLQAIQALQTPPVLTRPASTGVQVQPKPARNGVLGFFIGLGLGLALAFLRDALDTRVRSAEEVSERLALPLLARLPEPPAALRNANGLSMLEEPESLHAEAIRVLRTNLEFVNHERGARVIMVTSALEGEGKSTTVANLAVAYARAGRRVIAVDLDLRRPFLDKLIGIPRQPGVTQVALKYIDLDEALVPVSFMEPHRRREREIESRRRTRDGDRRRRTTVEEPEAEAVSPLLTEDWRPEDEDSWKSNGGPAALGDLRILPAGAAPPDVGEFVGSRSLAELLTSLREQADIVLVDSAPLLRVGDSITLSGRVDALVVATRLEHVRRPMLEELRRVLDSIPAEKLGFVLTGAELEAGYGYGYGFGYYGRREDEVGLRAPVL